MVLEANEDDIRRYIQWKLDMDDNFAENKDSDLFKKQIMDKIIETASRIGARANERFEKEGSARLNAKKLEDAFQVTIARINSQPLAKANQGMEVLKWTYLAKRQLSVIELRHALATVHSPAGAECLDLDDMPFEKSLAQYCYGLVVIDKETSSVRLVHESLQDFLKDQYENSKLFETGHRDITLSCLKYLSFSDESTSGTPVCDANTVKGLIYLGPNYKSFFYNCGFGTATSAHIDRFPILAYAIHFWGYHERGNIYQEIEQLAIELLHNQEKLYRLSRNLGSVRWYVPIYHWSKFDVNEMNEHLASSLMEFAGVHIIAYFGLDEIYEALVKKLDNLDINRKILWKTALLLAVEQGHYAVVRQLIEVEGIDIDPKNEDGGTPLFCAAEHGDEAIVRLLFEKGAQVDPKDNEERTPLFYAA
ncbi:hypothetical protein FPQ18DRAFT_414163 [Pyronema domesticum]|nr:hypothetical protein FPQ18DRAFT_414163 [Pyronema domesticum]